MLAPVRRDSSPIFILPVRREIMVIHQLLVGPELVISDKRHHGSENAQSDPQ